MARKSRKQLDVAPILESPAPAVYNAAAYIRLSRDNAKRGDSLDTQQDIIENFIAASPDIRLVEVYSDNQTSGTRFERPAFKQMMEDAESGRINCIIVKDLSRFGRNAIDAGYYIEKQLPALGVRFVAVTDSFDSLEGDGGILLPLKNVIAESYALDISRKCKSVQRQNIRDGKFVGRMAPFGYDKHPKDCRRLVVDGEAAETVRQIFGWAADGIGAGEIVRMLNEANVLPPSHYKQKKGIIENSKLVGKLFWQKRTVKGILTDQVYVGDMVQGKTRTVNHKEIAVSPDEWICVQNTHEAIISRAQFDIVQNIMKQASEKDKKVRRTAVPYSPHVFRGKIFCSHCGQPMHRHRQNKDGIYWYRCESQWKLHKDACFVVSVKEAELQDAVFTLLRKYSETILGEKINRERIAPIKDAAAEKELKKIGSRLSQSKYFLKSLYENMLGGLITTDEFSTMKTAYETEMEMLSQCADEIRLKRQERASELEAYRLFSTATTQALSSHELSTDIIDVLVEKIFVKQDKSFEIAFQFADEFEGVDKVG